MEHERSAWGSQPWKSIHGSTKGRALLQDSNISWCVGGHDGTSWHLVALANRHDGPRLAQTYWPATRAPSSKLCTACTAGSRSVPAVKCLALRHPSLPPTDHHATPCHVTLLCTYISTRCPEQENKIRLSSHPVLTLVQPRLHTVETPKSSNRMGVGDVS